MTLARSSCSILTKLKDSSRSLFRIQVIWFPIKPVQLNISPGSLIKQLQEKGSPTHSFLRVPMYNRWDVCSSSTRHIDRCKVAIPIVWFLCVSILRHHFETNNLFLLVFDLNEICFTRSFSWCEEDIELARIETASSYPMRRQHQLQYRVIQSWNKR